MAAEDEGRSEDATERHLSKMREEGKIPQSPEVNGAIVLIVFCICLGVFGNDVGITLQHFTTRILRFQDAGNPTHALAALVPALLRSLGPILLITMGTGIVTSTIQTRGFFSLKMIEPKPEKLVNFMPAIKKMLPTRDAAVELGKNVLKLIAVGGVIVKIIHDALPEFAQMPSMPIGASAAMVVDVAGDVALWGSVSFLLVALIDWYYQNKKFAEEAKMTKNDVKDEHKQVEGDPQIKAKIRQKARELSGRRAIADTETATVIVTNPTHISIALRYEQGQDQAPIVVAKGVDAIAMKMRSVARQHGIPIVENKPIARAMYANVQTGQPIPFELYGAIAEIIAHVMRLKGSLVA